MPKNAQMNTAMVKNIWRFETVPILYKNRDYEGQYLSHYENDMDIYVTFAGGSLVKTSTP